MRSTRAANCADLLKLPMLVIEAPFKIRRQPQFLLSQLSDAIDG